MSAQHGLLGRIRGWFTAPEPTTPAPTPHRADHARIAVLEHQLLGIQPEPGTPAAVAVAHATPVDQERCPHDDWTEITTWGQARRSAWCVSCGADLVAGDDGVWVRP